MTVRPLELHPGKLTWNPKIPRWKGETSTNGRPFFGFHVSFRECIAKIGSYIESNSSRPDFENCWSSAFAVAGDWRFVNLRSPKLHLLDVLDVRGNHLLQATGNDSLCLSGFWSMGTSTFNQNGFSWAQTSSSTYPSSI